MFPLLVLFMSWRLCAAVHGVLQRYAPTNIAVRYLRSPHGLKWAIPAALVLTPAYLLTASACTSLIDRGGPGWIHVLVLLLIWNAMKFGLLGVLAPGIALARVVKPRVERVAERRASLL